MGSSSSAFPLVYRDPSRGKSQNRVFSGSCSETEVFKQRYYKGKRPEMNNLFLGLLFVFAGKALLAEELTKEQLWAIALTGIMTERNKSNYDTLNSSAMNARNQKNWLEVLKRDWGINNRKELLETLDKMERDGHAGDLQYIQHIIRETLEEKSSFDIIALYNRYQLSSRQYNYVKFTVANWNVFSGRNILAWDLGRNIALCRWGV
jgi:hypothetical protein